MYTFLGFGICFFVILPAMDIQDQLKKLFPEHQPSNESEVVEESEHILFIQKECNCQKLYLAYSVHCFVYGLFRNFLCLVTSTHALRFW